MRSTHIAELKTKHHLCPNKCYFYPLLANFLNCHPWTTAEWNIPSSHFDLTLYPCNPWLWWEDWRVVRSSRLMNMWDNTNIPYLTINSNLFLISWLQNIFLPLKSSLYVKSIFLGGSTKIYLGLFFQLLHWRFLYFTGVHTNWMVFWYLFPWDRVTLTLSWDLYMIIWTLCGTNDKASSL